MGSRQRGRHDATNPLVRKYLQLALLVLFGLPTPLCASSVLLSLAGIGGLSMTAFIARLEAETWEFLR